MEKQQAYYQTWEEYTQEHPEVADERYHTNILQDYEDDLYKFIIGLLI